MKVLYLAPLFKESGGYVHIKEFVNAFSKTEHKIFEGFDNINLSVDKIPQIARKLPRIIKEFAFIAQGLQYIKTGQKCIDKFKPDIILARDTGFNYWAPFLAKINKLPLVLEVNGPSIYEMKIFFKISLYKLATFIERQVWKSARANIVVSNVLKNYLIQKGVCPKRIFVVPNGVNISKLNKSVSGDKILKKYGLEKKIVIGFHGTLQKWHGVDMLLKAAKEIIKVRKNVSFLLVGKGRMESELRQYVEQNSLSDFVIFTSRIPYDNIPPYIAAMDIVVMPYPLIDNFYFSPIKLFEYMAMGKALVASNIGQIGEIVENRKDGLLITPGNKRELIESLLFLIDNEKLREKLGKNLNKKVVNYTWNVNAQKIVAILEKCII